MDEHIYSRFLSVKASRKRFSELLLEANEFYFEDVSVLCLPPKYLYEGRPPSFLGSDGTLKGRLKLCSQSVVFVPEEGRLPIYKFLFKTLKADPTINKSSLVLTCSGIVECAENGVAQPYNVREPPSNYGRFPSTAFSLLYVDAGSVLSKVSDLLKIFKLPAHRAEASLDAYVQMRERSTVFDASWQEDLLEQHVFETGCSRVKPLVHVPGIILLTNERLYFQPLNDVSSKPVKKMDLQRIVHVWKRFYLHQPLSLEIFFEDKRSLLLTFHTEYDRDKLHDLLLAQPECQTAASVRLEDMTASWVKGSLSNFEYLMFLNYMAGRTFNDISQYPVFPWVLADYSSETIDLSDPSIYRDLSVPIGALNPDRLASYLERYSMMPENEKFLYGTHYSTPAFILYYLVRYIPVCMLKLQGGKYDAPSRLFHSIPETWEGVLNNPTDVKELIPEFYIPEMADSFLLNHQRLRLGQRPDNCLVDNVVLPPWADSPRNFCETLRAALESDYVSSKLHHWIDLIFGYKQRGKEAVRAQNLFYPLTYEGHVDLGAIKDPVERRALELQIREFGQTPKQLFSRPHPARALAGTTAAPSVDEPLSTSTATGRSSASASAGSGTNSTVPRAPVPTSHPVATRDVDSLHLEESDHDAQVEASPEMDSSRWVDGSMFQWTEKLHRDSVNCVVANNDGDMAFSVGMDGYLKVYSFAQRKQSRSMHMSDMALSGCVLANNESTVLAAGWSGHIYAYSIPYGSVESAIDAHDDAVSCIALSRDLACTGSWDTTVHVWSVEHLVGSAAYPVAQFNDHPSELQAVRFLDSNRTVLAACTDGSMHLWDVQTCTLQASYAYPDEYRLSCVDTFPQGSTCVTGSYDGTIALFDLRLCKPTFAMPTAMEIRSISCDDSTVWTGNAAGEMHVWDARMNLRKVGALTTRVGPITSLHRGHSGSCIFLSGDDGSIGKLVCE